MGTASGEHRLDDGGSWLWLTLVAGLLSVLKGLRLPNLWSATQAGIDYQYGFTRRGLFGELMRQLHVPTHRYAVFVVIAYLALVCCLVRCVLLTVRARLFQSQRGRALTGLFFGSYAVSCLADQVGYFDPILISLAFAAIAIERPLLQLAGAAAATALGVLVHEQFVPSFLPLVLLPAVFQVLAAARSRLPVLLLSVGVAAAALGFVAYVSNLVLAPNDLATLHRSLADRVDFPLRDDFFSVLTNNAAANRAKMLELASAPWWIELFKLGLWLTIPTIMLLIAGSLRRIEDLQRIGRARLWLLRLCAVGASLAPLSLHLVAWDALRWDAQAVVSSFGVLLVTELQSRQLGAEPEPEVRAGRLFQLVALSLMLLNAASGGGLESGRTNVYPYREGLRELVQRSASGRFLAPRP